MKTKLLSLLVVVFCCVSLSYAQVSPFSHEAYISDAGDTLLYRRMVSDYDTVSRYPLVIFLHGSGERGNDNEAQLKWGVMNFATDRVMKNYRPIVIAPQCPSGSGWGNYTYGDQLTLQPTPTPTMKLLIELINQTIATMPVDPDRVYITGLSMGGFGTFDAISRYPDLFAAAVPVCGGGDVSKAQTFAHMPIWVFHGALDAGVSPFLSTQMIAALMEAGANPGFTLYPEAGHFSWVAAYSDPMLMEWLFSQRR
ncbi:carboxylesterase family protein [Reichenbachiella ulvae]|uniref:Prolyl oligopeptidase family serine peptidase n=1 Tax=Reichenbachiella ulvae TaxID=2980104 RepID=A0ABT3CUB1_9BACT|nr:prolyl oligopeptidase family serine peptidase [Reichenbachiella ulvae]MCV9387282.1 prolyl oligopeptidase family serine peptidase [Reichenbachiella ulvae]